MAEIRGPTADDRTTIIGKTGSGKSVFGLHLLSSRDFDKRPWVIIDYKGADDLLNRVASLPSVVEITPNKPPPTKPGLYYMNPTPKLDDEAMEAWLYQVWNNGRKGTGTGLFIDEGYQLPQRDAFDIILTQGRALHIPVITHYQRPTWMSRFAVAQASFFAIFDQNDERDIKTTQSFIKPAKLPNGQKVDVYTELPDYHSLWYDVSRGVTNVLSPAPNEEIIYNTFRRRLAAMKRKGQLV